MSTTDHGRVKVKTTLPKRPFPLNSVRPAILTDRLTIRALLQSDIDALHHMRSQAEVMIWTSLGRPTRDLAETQTTLDRFLAPNDENTFNFAICSKETDTMIGIGGVHEGRYAQNATGWPEIGYMFTHENWGRGYATEFLQGFLGAWWALERHEIEMEIDPETIGKDLIEKGAEAGQLLVVPEQVVALVLLLNAKSLRVVDKCGFRRIRTLVEKDAHEGSDKMIEVGIFAAERQESI